jgi:penicillin-binding protein 1A
VNGVFARLALEIGPGAIATQAELMGVRTRLPRYPSIALGSAEVSALDMATAYATLANGGTAVRPTTIKEIRTGDGQVLTPLQQETPNAISPGNAYLLTRTLQDVIERGTGQAARIGRPAAGKTGTTDDHADAWFVGYTPDLVTAVWVGYPQGRVPMTSVHGTRVWGGNFPAYIWRSFMAEAVRGTPVGRFRLPDEDLVSIEIDPDTGLLAAPWCPGKVKRMLRQLAPTELCPSPEPSPVDSPKDEPKDDERRSPSPTETEPRADATSPEPEPTE